VELTDTEARAEILRVLATTTNLGALRRQIYLASSYGVSGPVGYATYRFIHYGEPAGLDDELKRGFVEALRRIAIPRALELASVLEAERG
jgi:hypothetical protein